MAANSWVHCPATPGRALRWLPHTQRGRYLVPNPEETIMAPTKQSIPRSVDVSVHRHGVSTLWLISALSVKQPPYLNDLVWIVFVVHFQLWFIPGVEGAWRFHWRCTSSTRALWDTASSELGLDSHFLWCTQAEMGKFNLKLYFFFFFWTPIIRGVVSVAA